MDSTTLSLVALGMAFAQVIKGITGFGSALLSMPILLWALPPQQAILVMSATDLIAGGVLVWDEWSRIRWRLVAIVLIGVTAGQWIGTDLLQVLDVSVTKRLLGTVVLLLGAQFAWNPVSTSEGELDELPDRAGRVFSWGFVAGAAGGLMSGLVGASGPPLVAYSKRTFADRFGRAQLIAIFQVSGCILIAMLLYKGANPEAMRSVPMLLLPVLAGNRLGAWAMPRVSRVAFGRLTGAVLVISGIALWW